MRVYGVDYQFLSCGDVFTRGLYRAAASLDVAYAHSAWDDPLIEARIRAFQPDLLFAVHGRRFAQRFPNPRVLAPKTAVWLLDEPYEVDDTSEFSKRFDRVFVNDESTLHRHHNASFLPTCYDPALHHSMQSVRPHQVGFVGGGNNRRERTLGALAHAGLLTYVVGGYWADPRINAVCISANVKPEATAILYASTKVVVNVFREQHHYNAKGLPATAMNPRIYEALACGAVVVSEPRDEIASRLPWLPIFRSDAECVDVVKQLLANYDAAVHFADRCRQELNADTYAARLATVVNAMASEVAA